MYRVYFWVIEVQRVACLTGRGSSRKLPEDAASFPQQCGASRFRESGRLFLPKIGRSLRETVLVVCGTATVRRSVPASPNARRVLAKGRSDGCRILVPQKGGVGRGILGSIASDRVKSSGNDFRNRFPSPVASAVGLSIMRSSDQFGC